MLRESENVSRSVSCFITDNRTFDTKGIAFDMKFNLFRCKTSSVTENRLTTFVNSDDYGVQF